MEIGMSLACFYPLEPECAVPKAAALNMKVCELFLNTVSELDEQYIADMRQTCDQHGIRIHSIHPFTSSMENYLFFSPYPRRIADAMVFYRRYAEAAKALGATVVNIHGERGLGLNDFESYVNCLETLRRLQDETGITFALENVYFNSVDHPEFTARLRQRVPDIRFTFDIKQAVKGGQDPYALAEAMGTAIANFHVNDCDAEHVCLLPGKGTIDYDRIGSILQSNGYDGPALIEVYRENFQHTKEIGVAKSFLESKFMLAK
ncbi:MAG: sugar phosphate isomerase/epimerase [Clostridia bacterium]|nr:sugar phosphate isomerase/epimerase [Clostridia bacterium]